MQLAHCCNPAAMAELYASGCVQVWQVITSGLLPSPSG